jgi:hypothetical protein
MGLRVGGVGCRREDRVQDGCRVQAFRVEGSGVKVEGFRVEEHNGFPGAGSGLSTWLT